MVMLTRVHKHVQKDGGQGLNNAMVWKSREVFRVRIFILCLVSQSAFGFNNKHNIKKYKQLQSGLSSRAKHGGTVFSAVSGSIKDLATVPGSYNRLGP